MRKLSFEEIIANWDKVETTFVTSTPKQAEYFQRNQSVIRVMAYMGMFSVWVVEQNNEITLMVITTTIVDGIASYWIMCIYGIKAFKKTSDDGLKNAFDTLVSEAQKTGIYQITFYTTNDTIKQWGTKFGATFEFCGTILVPGGGQNGR